MANPVTLVINIISEIVDLAFTHVCEPKYHSQIKKQNIASTEPFSIKRSLDFRNDLFNSG